MDPPEAAGGEEEEVGGHQGRDEAVAQHLVGEVVGAVVGGERREADEPVEGRDEDAEGGVDVQQEGQHGLCQGPALVRGLLAVPS